MRLNNYEVQEEHDYIIYNYFLFSIAGACASDANATATATVNDYITDEINEIEANNPASDDSKILAASAGNEILKSSTTVTNHTFEAIQSAIDEGYDTIYLEPLLTRDSALPVKKAEAVIFPRQKRKYS